MRAGSSAGALSMEHLSPSDHAGEDPEKSRVPGTGKATDNEAGDPGLRLQRRRQEMSGW